MTSRILHDLDVDDDAAVIELAEILDYIADYLTGRVEGLDPHITRSDLAADLRRWATRLNPSLESLPK